MQHTIVYAHGFKSASKSHKATMLKQYLRAHHPDVRFVAPDLNFRPTQAISQLQWCCLGKPPETLTVVGSSLGGFYAIQLAEKLGCRAVLLNPSIAPYETLAAHLGEHTNLYTGERFVFEPLHIAELSALAVPALTRPERYLLLVEMGDALLDHNKTIAYCQGARQIVVPDGDHALTSFPAHLPALVAFALA